MKWQKHSDYALVSEDGRYSVAKIGYEGGAFYESWRTRNHKEGPHLIASNLSSAAEARKLCEADDDLR